jgi:hypothetical protein
MASPAGDRQVGGMNTETTDITTTVDRYLAAYGEPDATRRADLIASAWAPDGRLVDPPAVGEGHDGIGALAQALQAQFAGHRFRRTSAVDAHHEVARYRWELVAPDGAVALAGMDVARFAPDGRLLEVTGFFGEPAPVED